MHLNTFKYCTYYLCIYWKFKEDIASLNHCSLELLIYFSCQIIFVTLLILLGQAKMWVRLYFLPHVAFAECLVHSDVADSESAFFPLWNGLAHIFKVSHIHPLQPLSAEVCIGTRLWIRPLGVLPVFRSATLQATIKYVPHALNSFQTEKPKSKNLASVPAISGWV